MARDCANSLLPDLPMPLVTNKPRYRKCILDLFISPSSLFLI
nr:MAG TPA: hypothetical protein [Caudoviricetes sp.]DAY78883.1 MAG TPA: hypothetical protein [Caudoviricetes sp.]